VFIGARSTASICWLSIWTFQECSWRLKGL